MGRIFKVSHGTIFHRRKKMTALPAFTTTILPAQSDDVLEVDEIFTFIALSKSFPFVFGLLTVVGRGKSLRSFSVMEIWNVARLSGKNFPTIINGG